MYLYQSVLPWTCKQSIESSLLHLLALIWYFQSLYICLSYECQIVFCFTFHFSDDYWGGAPFHMFFFVCLFLQFRFTLLCFACWHLLLIFFFFDFFLFTHDFLICLFGKQFILDTKPFLAICTVVWLSNRGLTKQSIWKKDFLTHQETWVFALVLLTTCILTLDRSFNFPGL